MRLRPINLARIFPSRARHSRGLAVVLFLFVGSINASEDTFGSDRLRIELSGALTRQPSSVVKAGAIPPAIVPEAERQAIAGISKFNEGNLDAAKSLLSEAVRLDPTREDAHVHLGILLDLKNDTAGAVREYRATLKQNSSHPTALNNLAWILATDPKPDHRNGQEALRLAERACKTTDYREPMFLATLAAAHAEVGRFAEALALAKRGLALVKEAKVQESKRRLEASIECYELRLPFREIGGN